MDNNSKYMFELSENVIDTQKRAAKNAMKRAVQAAQVVLDKQTEMSPEHLQAIGLDIQRAATDYARAQDLVNVWESVKIQSVAIRPLWVNDGRFFTKNLGDGHYHVVIVDVLPPDLVKSMKNSYMVTSQLVDFNRLTDEQVQGCLDVYGYTQSALEAIVGTDNVRRRTAEIVAEHFEDYRQQAKLTGTFETRKELQEFLKKEFSIEIE